MMDYPELVAEVTDRTGHADVATRAAMFVNMAEARLNTMFRTQDATATITASSTGALTLPSDYARPRLVTVAGREAFPRPIDAILDGTKQGYAISGAQMLTSFPSQAVTIRYYTRLPSLVTNSTNWLIELDPEIYLYAVMAQVFAFKMEADKAALATGQLMLLVDQRKTDDFVRKFGGQGMENPGAGDMY